MSLIMIMLSELDLPTDFVTENRWLTLRLRMIYPKRMNPHKYKIKGWSAGIVFILQTAVHRKKK